MTGRERIAGLVSTGGGAASPSAEFPKPPKALLEFGPQEFRDAFMQWWRAMEEWRKGNTFNAGGPPVAGGG